MNFYCTVRGQAPQVLPPANFCEKSCDFYRQLLDYSDVGFNCIVNIEIRYTCTC